MNDAQHAAVESGSLIVAKAAPPATVSIATLWGYQVNELLIWATLIYTTLMIGHKVYTIIKDIRDSRKTQ